MSRSIEEKEREKEMELGGPTECYIYIFLSHSPDLHAAEALIKSSVYISFFARLFREFLFFSSSLGFPQSSLTSQTLIPRLRRKNHPERRVLV